MSRGQECRCSRCPSANAHQAMITPDPDAHRSGQRTITGDFLVRSKPAWPAMRDCRSSPVRRRGAARPPRAPTRSRQDVLHGPLRSRGHSWVPISKRTKCRGIGFRSAGTAAGVSPRRPRGGAIPSATARTRVAREHGGDARPGPARISAPGPGEPCTEYTEFGGRVFSVRRRGAEPWTELTEWTELPRHRWREGPSLDAEDLPASRGPRAQGTWRTATPPSAPPS